MRRVFLTLTIAALAMLFALVSDAGKPRPVQDVFIFCPDELDPGSKAAFRVVVVEAVSLKESRPIQGAQVEISLKGDKGPSRVLFAKTDSNGTVDNDARVPDLSPGEYELIVNVRSELGEVEKKHAIELKPKYRILLSTDKPLYQPGQLIHIRSVSLKTSDLSPVARRKVTIEVEDPQGNKVFKKSDFTDRYGISSADFQLADEIRMGEYAVRAMVGERETEKSVTVKKYVLPKFKVSLETDKSYYAPGDKLTGTVDANYFFGKPVSGGHVKVVAQAFDVEFHDVAEASGKTDKDGSFKFDLTLPGHFVGQPLEKGDAFIKIEAKVTDTADHEESALIERKVSASDLRVELVPEAGRIIPGVENKIFAVTSTPNDEPVSARIEIEIGGEKLTADSDDVGVAEFSFTPDPEDFKSQDVGYQDWQFDPSVRNKPAYVIEAKIKAEAKNGAKVTATRTLSADALKDNVLLRSDKAVYRSGDEVKLTVLSTFSSGTAYLDVIKDRRTVLTRSLDLAGGKAAHTITLGPDLFGTLETHAYMILPSGEIVRDAKVVYVEPPSDLKISVSLDKDVYRPGEQALLSFKVTDESGKGKAAALGVSIVDESVFAIQDMRPGLLKVYFTLEEELAKPRYEIHLSPGGESVQSLILEDAEARRKKDKVMKVLLAGVEKPTEMGWKENPAKTRMDNERGRIENFMTAFFAYSYDHPFIEKKKGTWDYIEDLGSLMEKEGDLAKDYVNDPFGNPYTPEILKTLDPSMDVYAVTRGVASFRLHKFYNALDRYYYDEQRSWLDKLFANDAPADIPDDVMDKLLDKGYLDKGADVDPWGEKFMIRKLGDDETNPYGGPYPHFQVFSAGPDGKAGTDDDVADPYAYSSHPYLSRLGGSHRWMFAEEEGLIDKIADFPGIALGGAMMRDTAAMPETAPKMRKKNGGGHEEPDTSSEGGGKIRVREYFPETLWWEPALITDRFGEASLAVPMADSITTWRLTALAHSGGGNLGSGVSGIRVFQDFFADIDFPVQLTQNDEVEIPVQVYNYLPGSQTVKLEIRERDGFELLSDSVQELRLESGQVDVRYFRLKAVDVGRKALTVYAIGGKMSDAVKRTVEVVPDGKRFEVVRNGRITGPLTEEIEIPEAAVKDGSRVMVKVYPGVFAQVLEGMDGIFRMPSGCFEQTTSTTYPNVMVLNYMKKTGTISPEIQMKAEGFINVGYQRLLSFEVPGGGFEWFGNPPAHKVLTAYGLMEFYDMSKVYPIDESVITRTQNWLVGQQESDGTWKPVEHWLETLSGEDFSKSVELNTAYIAWALAESGYKGEALDKSISYLKDNMEKMKDAYTLALALNAMVAADPSDKDARELLRKLEGMKIEDKKTGTAHWEPAGETAVHGSGKSAMIETTALIVYAIIQANASPNTANQGLAWLGQQKDAFGTFESTQATILSLKAMLAAEEGKAPDVKGDITVALGERKEMIEITPENSDVLRLVDFKDQTRTGVHKVDIQAPDDLGLMYQVVGIYYLPWDLLKKIEVQPLLSLDLKYDRTKLAKDDLLTASVTAEYVGEKATDMVILDLGVPPGFSLIPDAFERMKEDKTIEKFTATGRQITVYVRRMEAGKPLKFDYQLKAKFPVKAQAPKSSAYQYYNPDQRIETRPIQIEVTR